MFSLKSLVLFATSTFALPAWDPVLRDKSAGFPIRNVGTFQQHVTYKFTGNSLPDGLYASSDFIAGQSRGAPYNHQYDPSNVVVRNGFLELRVPGNQHPTEATNYSVSAAEVFTAQQDILYASVRTRAIFSTVKGTCQSSFFYKTDNQETDIEYLSDPASEANNGDGASIHYTNQGLLEGEPSTTAHGPAPANVGTAVHEYRLDWTAGFTAFYIDGVLQKKHTVNVPNVAGTWLWNNWANGDIQWTVGPPAQDSVMKIQSIDMYFNTTG